VRGTRQDTSQEECDRNSGGTPAAGQDECFHRDFSINSRTVALLRDSDLPSLAAQPQGRASGERNARVEEALGFFPEIAEKRHERAVALSGGQQQMLAVAQGLVRRPRLLMLDEPSAGLSPVLVDRVFVVVRRLREASTAVLLVEQLIEKALTLADRVYALARGSIVLEAPTSEADSRRRNLAREWRRSASVRRM
jgi:ABC-type branched-subunit amino acid transport system ATPase component